MIDRKVRLTPIHTAVLLIMAFHVGCSPISSPPTEITPGSTKEDVIAVYGEPDRTQEFIIPDEPFFGPQENLTNLVPPGTTIEEWVYETGEEELYIWFSGDDDARENWLVLALGKYPKGAVY